MDGGFPGTARPISSRPAVHRTVEHGHVKTPGVAVTRRSHVRIQLIVASLAIVTGCASATVATRLADVPEIKPGILAGYLPNDAWPNSLALLPPPPVPGSAAMVADAETYRVTRALRDTPRWALATYDANLSFPEAAGAFSCALDAPITQEATPRLYVLMRRILADGGLATYAAKDHYQRRRPFLEYNEPTCTPQEEHLAAEDASYPSGHASVGWTWALVLAELAPERADALLARGYAFGQSRVICGAHWQSDVTAGRVVGAAVVALLHVDATFRADLAAAKGELAAARRRGFRPPRDCAAEAAALAVISP
jgi:acid phosphatase (class A)